MPKCNINDETCAGWRVEVSWRPNNQDGDIPGHVQVATVNVSTEEVRDIPEPFDGWWVTLNPAGIDRMIEALEKARDSAFGKRDPRVRHVLSLPPYGPGVGPDTFGVQPPTSNLTEAQGE